MWNSGLWHSPPWIIIQLVTRRKTFLGKKPLVLATYIEEPYLKEPYGKKILICKE